MIFSHGEFVDVERQAEILKHMRAIGRTFSFW